MEISVTTEGFVPAKTPAKKGETIKLVFTRKTDATCAKDVIVPAPDGKVKKDLPMNTPVEITIKPTKAGEIVYTCGHGHITGAIVVQ